MTERGSFAAGDVSAGGAWNRRVRLRGRGQLLLRGWAQFHPGQRRPPPPHQLLLRAAAREEALRAQGERGEGNFVCFFAAQTLQVIVFVVRPSGVSNLNLSVTPCASVSSGDGASLRREQTEGVPRLHPARRLLSLRRPHRRPLHVRSVRSAQAHEGGLRALSAHKTSVCFTQRRGGDLHLVRKVGRSVQSSGNPFLCAGRKEKLATMLVSFCRS